MTKQIIIFFCCEWSILTTQYVVNNFNATNIAFLFNLGIKPVFFPTCQDFENITRRNIEIFQTSKY